MSGIGSATLAMLWQFYKHQQELRSNQSKSHSQQYGSYNKSTQSLIELFAVNFFDYSIVLLNKPFDYDEKINLDYLKMIDTLRENKLVIYFGSNNTLNDTELLGGYKDKYIRIDEIGEVFDDED